MKSEGATSHSRPRRSHRGATIDGPFSVGHGAALALVGVMALAFWGTAASTSWARVAAVQCVEPYAFAVHEQLVKNFSTNGAFSQTIHRGYDDAWTWSGHRAPTLVLAGWLYGLNPSAFWLSQIMILGVLLGAIPAALIGRRALRSGWGLALGGAIYLGCPAVMALALQDYQDLVFALPCLTFAMWALGSGRWWLVVVGTMVAVLPREECVGAVVLAALTTLPQVRTGERRRRRWLLNVGVVLAVVAAYSGLMQWFFPVNIHGAGGGGQGYTPSLINATAEAIRMLSSGTLPGLQLSDGFYLLVWLPVGFLALFSPTTLLAGLAMLVMHMTVPDGNGIDRRWAAHAHHMAPVMAFVVVATILGSARLLRLIRGEAWLGWIRRDNAARKPQSPGRAGLALAVAAAAVLAIWGAIYYAAWSERFNLVRAWTASRPRWFHPAWALMRRLPNEAVPVVSMDLAIIASNFSTSYTYEESLWDKAGGKGLGAATHLVVDARHQDVRRWGMAMPGAHVLARESGYELISWRAGASDPMASRGLPTHGGPFRRRPISRRFDLPGVPKEGL